jgi:hypothetical protein
MIRSLLVSTYTTPDGFLPRLTTIIVMKTTKSVTVMKVNHRRPREVGSVITVGVGLPRSPLPARTGSLVPASSAAVLTD